MAGRWVDVVRLAFKGERFRDHALDLRALGELSRFQKIISDTAKALWRAAHPERERLPRHFEERTRLCLRKIEEASAVAPLEVYIQEPEVPELFEPEPTEAREAIALAQRVLRAAEMDLPLPQPFPRALIAEYESFGQGLADDEAIVLIVDRAERARVTAASRARLAAVAESAYESHIDVTGQVLEADVRDERFEVWLDADTCIIAPFSAEQEDEVTRALRDHRTLRLQVVGRGEFSSSGEPKRVTQVDELRLHPAGEAPYDPEARPIEEILAQLGAQVPQEEWNRVPADLTDNLDHYLYGTPRE